MNSWSQFLSRFEQEFQEAVEDFEPIPDGEYQAIVDVARLMESRTGRPMVELQLVISEGRYQFRRERKFHILEEGRIRFLKRDLIALGIHLERLADLPQQLPKAMNQSVPIQIETRTGNQGKRYRNIYILRDSMK